jgi:hypothetical protein
VIRSRSYTMDSNGHIYMVVPDPEEDVAPPETPFADAYEHLLSLGFVRRRVQQPPSNG